MKSEQELTSKGDSYTQFSSKLRITLEKIMVNIADLRIGDKVHYKPDYFREDQWENGIVKEIPPLISLNARVVYNCNGDWENYKEYTSALTQAKDLFLGWRHE